VERQDDLRAASDRGSLGALLGSVAPFSRVRCLLAPIFSLQIVTKLLDGSAANERGHPISFLTSGRRSHELPTDFNKVYHQVGIYAARILESEKPADQPSVPSQYCYTKHFLTKNFVRGRGLTPEIAPAFVFLAAPSCSRYIHRQIPGAEDEDRRAISKHIGSRRWQSQSLP
jgi:hypothetical protein